MDTCLTFHKTAACLSTRHTYMESVVCPLVLSVLSVHSPYIYGECCLSTCLVCLVCPLAIHIWRVLSVHLSCLSCLSTRHTYMESVVCPLVLSVLSVHSPYIYGECCLSTCLVCLVCPLAIHIWRVLLCKAVRYDSYSDVDFVHTFRRFSVRPQGQAIQY